MAGLALRAQTGGYIDAHSHVWSADARRYPRIRPLLEREPASFTPQELFRHAKPCGVTRVVLIQISFYGTDNSYMLDAIARQPDVFSGVAIVTDAGRMAEMARRGVRGFRITPGNQPRTWLDTPAMDAMWRRGAEQRLAMCPLVSPDALPSIDAMCRKHPETPVVIDHLARVGADGTIRDADVRQLCALARHRRVHVKVSAFYTLGKRQFPYLDMAGMLRRIFDAFGPERLMWGSDSPFQVRNGHTYAGSLDLVRERLEFLSSADRRWILRKSAEQVFFQGAKAI